MYYYFYFKSGLKKKILVSGKNGALGLYQLIEEVIKRNEQFIMFNAEIIRIDAIEHIEPAQ